MLGVIQSLPAVVRPSRAAAAPPTASAPAPRCRRSCARARAADAGPATAIIAALSVQNSSRGKYTCAPSAVASRVSRARSSRLAPTPPATTSARWPVNSSARSALAHKRRDDRVLHGVGHIGARLVGQRRGAHRLHHRGLESGETELESWPIEHRPRKRIPPRPSGCGQLRQLRPARIRQAQQLGALVESLARGIVAGLPEHPVVADAAHLDQHRVAAGYQQRDMRERRCRRFQHRRQQMAFEMMHADRRHLPAETQARAPAPRRSATRRPGRDRPCRRPLRSRRRGFRHRQSALRSSGSRRRR